MCPTPHLNGKHVVFGQVLKVILQMVAPALLPSLATATSLKKDGVSQRGDNALSGVSLKVFDRPFRALASVHCTLCINVHPERSKAEGVASQSAERKSRERSRDEAFAAGLQGYGTVRDVEETEKDGEKPNQECRIVDSGELPQDSDLTSIPTFIAQVR